ncbi:MAG: manganese-dependent inorganic pyrophosphatase [Mycoplasmatales bacterium]
MSILIFGHKNPDTDSVISSLVLNDYLKLKGQDTVSCMLGNLSKETSYILERENMEPPKIIDKVEDGQEVMMVDHNEFTQSVSNIENAKILRVIDHHRVNNFKTDYPLDMRLETVGCSNTILYKLYKESNLEPTDTIKRLILSAIISDTLLFKSPTCTQEDKDIANEIINDLNIDVQDFGMKILKAGTDLSGKSAKDILNIDAKEFPLDNKTYKVAQINTADIETLLEEYESSIREEVNNELSNGISTFIVMITDIVNSNSLLLILGNDVKELEQSFNVILNNDKALLEGVVSRKKQIVPNLK